MGTYTKATLIVLVSITCLAQGLAYNACVLIAIILSASYDIAVNMISIIRIKLLELLRDSKSAEKVNPQILPNAYREMNTWPEVKQSDQKHS